MQEECEEEVEECEEEVEARDPRGERRSAGSPDLTEDQKAFLLAQKSLKATYKEIVKRWSEKFSRKPPSRSSLKKNVKKLKKT